MYIDAIPECGRGQQIQFDPFGQAICVCRSNHWRLIDDDVTANSISVDLVPIR
jgi:hypothetical protein